MVDYKVMNSAKNCFYTVLFIVNVLSVIILLQVVFEVIPYWNCDWSTDKISRVNDMAKDFSITVISSTLFYFLLVIIPEKVKRQQIRSNTIGAINQLANLMQEIIAYLVFRDSITQNDPHYLDLDVESLGKITSFCKSRCTDFCYSGCQNGKKILADFHKWDEVSFLRYQTSLVKQEASNYLDIPIIIYEDPELVFLIRQIRNCSFISNIKMICNNSLPIYISTLNKSIIEFYAFYQSLCKYATDMAELYVGDKEAIKGNSFPIKCCK